MERIKWVFKWYEAEDKATIFVPFITIPKGKNETPDCLGIFASKGQTSSDWYDLKYVKENWKKTTPSSEDKREQIKYVFEYNDYFEGLDRS